MYIVARTDARGVEGLDAAIERANAYVKAGSRCNIPRSASIGRRIPFYLLSKVNAPLLANMTEFGKTPYYSAEEFANMGYPNGNLSCNFTSCCCKSI